MKIGFTRSLRSAFVLPSDKPTMELNRVSTNLVFGPVRANERTWLPEKLLLRVLHHQETLEAVPNTNWLTSTMVNSETTIAGYPIPKIRDGLNLLSSNPRELNGLPGDGIKTANTRTAPLQPTTSKLKMKRVNGSKLPPQHPGNPELLRERMAALCLPWIIWIRKKNQLHANSFRTWTKRKRPWMN